MSVACVFECPQGGLCLSRAITLVIASAVACANEARYGDFPRTIFHFFENPDGPKPNCTVGGKPPPLGLLWIYQDGWTNTLLRGYRYPSVQ